MLPFPIRSTPPEDSSEDDTGPKCQRGTFDGWSAGRLAALACQWEATIFKVGNVHPAANFQDLTFAEMLAAANALGQAIDATADRSVGQSILAAVETTRRCVRSNANLGMILLLCPLAKAFQIARRVDPDSVRSILDRLTAADSRDVYRAIRLAGAGGLGQSEGHDLAGVPPDDLRAAMRMAADRDSVARQWSHEFVDLFDDILPALLGRLREWDSLTRAVQWVHIERIAGHGDSLIRRKCGANIDCDARQRAQMTLDAYRDGAAAFERAVADFDAWLRGDGNRRNPGTTADLIAAALFIGLCQRTIEWR